MDYEKKYREALKQAEEIISYYKEHNRGDEASIEDLMGIFPELKESEDEKVRKEIVRFIQMEVEDEIVGNKWLAWLKKQGEPMEINPTEFDTRLQTLIGKFDNLPKEELIGSLSFWLNVVQNDGTYKDEEKQGEQKPTDKVEPKFHEGDWVVISTSDGEKVVQIDSIEYFKSGEQRYITSEGRWFGNGTKAHLWTFQDAKDGDVIATEPIDSYPFPFVAIYKNHCLDFFNSHCFIGFNGKFYVGENGHSIENIHPATKEQHDLLFQKMKEAGYEWDAEKKELKKIEQKSQRMISAEVKEAMYDKPALSEEDELVIKDIEEAITNYWHGQSQEDLLDRLTSLKQRIGG